ncbi:mechanosensitive ion channel protein MscS, partial [Belliella pelovolcani]|uniref:mechanosensitive ion channel protein MscS n=1 Tax=Belliella pelovolcani TaxID=529505 RepID=UPI00391A6F68
MRIIFLFCFLLLLSFQGFAFQTDIEVLDTLLKVNEKLQEEEKPERPSLEGSIRKAQDFTIQLNRMNFNLNRELDTLSLMEDMPDIERLVNVIQSRLEDQDSKINIRYLNELDNLLRNIRVQVGDAERKVTARTEELIGAKSQLEDMKQSDLMKLDLRDSSILPEYQAALSQFRDRIAQTDSLLNGQRIFTAAFQTRISRMMIKISELSIALDVERRSAEAALLRKDINFIWEKKSYEPNLNLSTVFWESIRLNEVIFKRYIKNHIGMTIFFMLVFVGFSIWIKNLISKIRGEKEFAKIILERAHYVPKFPILSGVIILLPFIPFFYTNPTISFLTVLLWIAVLVVTVMLRSSFPSGLFRLWLMFVFIFFIYTVSNLYRDTNFSERWYLLFLSMIGIYLAVKIVRFKENNPELLPNLIDKLVKLYIGLQVFSILANIFGRFSLSKLLGVAATLSFAQAIGLYLFVQIVMEVIYLQIEVRRKSENDFTSYIDFHGIQTRVKRTLYGVASLIWVYYFLDNLSLLDLFIDQAGILLTTERSLFNTKFTYGNIVVFVVIVYVASLLANNIAYFATIKDQQQANLREKRLG